MAIIKSEGVTATEKLLADLCERSFLKLWSYPNPFNDDKKELCDLLAVFENHVFIFFDRESDALTKENKDPRTNWKRWKKKVIDNQIRTAHGAERYVKNGGSIFLDKDLTVPFPIDIDCQKMVVHKIIIAHGAKEACKNSSDDNVYGSLGMFYGSGAPELPFPFMIHMDKENPVHVFDSHNLPIIFSELDTFYDFTSYLDAKFEAIKTYDMLSYCGEEDLLAHYFLNFDEKTEVSPKLCPIESSNHAEQGVNKGFFQGFEVITANSIKILTQCGLGNDVPQVREGETVAASDFVPTFRNIFKP